MLSGVGGSQRTDGLEAPIFGRDAELRPVRELFHACAERRVPRLVSVSGPAGVGKSRLGWEFEKYVDGLASGIYWHRGRCLSYGEGVVFWALTEVVRQRFGIAEEDPIGDGRHQVGGGSRDLRARHGGRAYVGPGSGRLLGVTVAGDIGGTLAREELFAGWRSSSSAWPRAIPSSCSSRTPSTPTLECVDFLDHLVDWARDSPSSCSCSHDPSSTFPGPGSGAAATAPRSLSTLSTTRRWMA